MIYDGGDFVDGIEFDDFEAAKNDAIETLILWMAEETNGWKFDENGVPHPTEKQIESWDMTINDCCVYVIEWDEETGEWEDIGNAWFPSYEIENEIGWIEWEQYKKQFGW